MTLSSLYAGSGVHQYRWTACGVSAFVLAEAMRSPILQFNLKSVRVWAYKVATCANAYVWVAWYFRSLITALLNRAVLGVWRATALNVLREGRGHIFSTQQGHVRYCKDNVSLRKTPSLVCEFSPVKYESTQCNIRFVLDERLTASGGFMRSIWSEEHHRTTRAKETRKNSEKPQTAEHIIRVCNTSSLFSALIHKENK